MGSRVTHDAIVVFSALGVAGQVLALLLLLVGVAWLFGLRGPADLLRWTVEGYELWLVFVVSSASLILVYLAPGDFVTESLGAHASAESIEQARVRYGLNRVKTTLVTRLSTLGLPDEFKEVTVKDLNQRIKKLVGQSHRVPPDLVNLLLIQAHALIEYNGEGWHRLHPLVEEEFAE